MDYLIVVSIILLTVFTLNSSVFAQTEIPYDQKMNEVDTETATFALGCFWGPDASFGALEGVVRTRVGYAGGDKNNPTYKMIGDHTETIEIDMIQKLFLTVNYLKSFLPVMTLTDRLIRDSTPL